MENLGVNCSRKPRSPQQIPKSKSFQQNRFASESQNRTTNPKIIMSREEGGEMGLSARTKDPNEKKKNGSDPFCTKRPCTVFGTVQKKPEFGDRDRNPGIQMSKSFFSEPKDGVRERRRSLGGSRSMSPNVQTKDKQQCIIRAKSKSPVKNPRNNYTENFESLSLLSKAVYEQGQVIEMFCVAREELLKKIGEKIRADRKSREVSEEFEFEYFPPSGKDTDLSSFPDFENAYSGTLEEIFHAWVHLFYFIINLRINLIRVLNCATNESFRPKGELEKEVIRQAIECVKFFSLLKIKSLADSVDEFHLRNGQYMTQTQIRNYEQQLSNPFLCEMNFIQKKAREILCQAKTVTIM